MERNALVHFSIFTWNLKSVPGASLYNGIQKEPEKSEEISHINI